MTSMTPAEREGTFVARLSPPAHVMAFFENDQEFFAIVSEFVGAALASGDSVIVVATAAHLRGLDAEYARVGLDVDDARRDGRYTELDTNDVYDSLFAHGWPEQDCFDKVIREIIRRGRMPGRAVRCVGEVVAVTWGPRAFEASQDPRAYESTLRFEQHEALMVEAERMVLLCLYARSAFERNTAFDFRELARVHAKLED